MADRRIYVGTIIVAGDGTFVTTKDKLLSAEKVATGQYRVTLSEAVAPQNYTQVSPIAMAQTPNAQINALNPGPAPNQFDYFLVDSGNLAVDGTVRFDVFTTGPLS